MIVERFFCENFRNLKNIEIEPCPNINLIYGQNAQGKTNLLEGLWLFTGLRSFRGTKDAELKSIDCGENDRTKLGLRFFGGERHQEAEILIEKKRKAFLNGVELKKSAELSEHCHAIIFSPDDLTVIKEGPQERRRFLNTAICEVYPAYSELLKKYNRVLQQRNSLLKDLRYRDTMYTFLEDYEKVLASYGAKIIYTRKRYLEKISKYLPEIYNGLSGRREEIFMRYETAAEDTEEAIFEIFKKNRAEDILNGSTSVGPHRDDLSFTVNGLDVRKFGSQGQQRSVILSLKLSEAEMLKNVSGEQPIALLDDVMSELDPLRQDYILNHIKNWQVFVTLCDPFSIKRLKAGRTFHVEKGTVTKTGEN